VVCSKTNKADVYIMGNIGDDNYGKIVKESMSGLNINSQHLYTVKGVTAHHIINIDENGDRYFKPNSWHDGVWKDYVISDSDKIFMNGMDVVATTYYESTFKDILEIRKDSGFLLSVDFHDEKIDMSWEKYLNNIDLFFISGNNQKLEQLERWSKNFHTVFTATLGKCGSITYHKGNKYKCDAIKVSEVIDTTGCGDSYQGAFIVDYMLNKDIKSAMAKGSESAAITLSFVGGF
ncbi:MAG: PfkB family carbohydrate kinase, partial [Endomicrobiaceae bacterium]|nr:PfkB family carbohydrate kinase [Endomicrobiaceae bacterium]